MKIRATVTIDVDPYDWEGCGGSFKSNQVRSEVKGLIRMILTQEKTDGELGMIKSLEVK